MAGVGALTRRVARTLLGEYEPYLVFRLDRGDLAAAADHGPADVEYGAESADGIGGDPNPDVREQAWYGGQESLLFVAREAGTIVATLWCWYGGRYAQRGFIDLRPDEAKIVHVYTTAAARGRGVGSGLLRYACSQLVGERFRAVLARVWVTNEPSRRMFLRMGFRPTLFVLVVRPWPLRRPLRLEFRRPSLLHRLARR